MTTVVWRGLDEPRMEIAHVELGVRGALRASGTQIGIAYELRYELEPEVLGLAVVGDRRLEVGLEGCDFFDLAYSPLLNSLPVLRDDLLDGGEARDYVMRWVSVPDLETHESRQRYEPVGKRTIRFSTDGFVADIRFDDDGLVRQYEGLAERVA